MNDIQKKVLSTLVTKYEKSKSFLKQNKVEQTFSCEIGKLFPKYLDSREYVFFEEVNNSLFELEKKQLITLVKDGTNIVKTVFNFSEENIDLAYKLLKKKAKLQIQNELQNLLQKYQNLTNNKEFTQYLETQKKRLLENKNIDFFSNDSKANDLTEYENILKAVHFVLQNKENKEEIFIRDFSLLVFGNSKKFENIQSSVCSLLISLYENFEKDSVLEEFNIIKTPTYVCIKGNAIIYFENQQIDLSRLKSDIAFSTKTLQEIQKIKVFGRRVITIENLTSFHDFQSTDDFVIYLAGFHNQVKENFLKKVYKDNQNCEYKHFGDIDAGGFYIFENLKNKTQIPFSTFLMDIKTLQKYHNAKKTIQLTKNDRLRLEKFLTKIQLSSKEFVQYSEVINYMLENDCKLEQENVKVQLKHNIL